MKIFKINFIYLILIMISTFMVFSNQSLGSEGVFMIVKGDVKSIDEKGNTQLAKVGLKVKSGYKVKTGAGSQAKIVMIDKNILSIGENSLLEIKFYQNNEQGKKAHFNLNEGQVRAIVNEKYDDKQNTFRIKTPTAVAGVRGTDFKVIFDKSLSKTTIQTFKGVVSVVHISALSNNDIIKSSILVKAGESTEVKSDQIQPSPPQKISPQDMNQEQENSSSIEENNSSSKKEGASSSSKNNKISDFHNNIDHNSISNDQPSSNTHKPHSSENITTHSPDGKKLIKSPNQSSFKNQEVKDHSIKSNLTEIPNFDSQQNSISNYKSPSKHPHSLIKNKDLAPPKSSQLIPNNRIPASDIPPNIIQAPSTTISPINNNLNIINETISNQIKNEKVRSTIEISK